MSYSNSKYCILLSSYCTAVETHNDITPSILLFPLSMIKLSVFLCHKKYTASHNPQWYLKHIITTLYITLFLFHELFISNCAVAHWNNIPGLSCPSYHTMRLEMRMKIFWFISTMECLFFFKLGWWWRTNTLLLETG